jgi:hypothetical protein
MHNKLPQGTDLKEFERGRYPLYPINYGFPLLGPYSLTPRPWYHDRKQRGCLAKQVLDNFGDVGL